MTAPTEISADDLALCGDWVDRWLNNNCSNAEFDQINEPFRRLFAAARRGLNSGWRPIEGSVELCIPIA